MSAIYSFLIIISVLYFLIKQDNTMFFGVPPKKTAFISGFYFNYPALDHFPLIPWILLILIVVHSRTFYYKICPVPGSVLKTMNYLIHYKVYKNIH